MPSHEESKGVLAGVSPYVKEEQLPQRSTGIALPYRESMLLLQEQPRRKGVVSPWSSVCHFSLSANFTDLPLVSNGASTDISSRTGLLNLNTVDTLDWITLCFKWVSCAL